MSRRHKFLSVAVVALAAWSLLAPNLAKYLIVSKPLVKADAILVLSGSAVYRERTRKAAELYNQGLAPMVVISDDGSRAGWFSGEQGNPRYVDLEKRELTAAGVPAEMILVLPGTVSGTDDEARAISREIDSLQIRSLLIVTSAYHSRRSLWTFDRILSGKGVTVGIAAPAPGQHTPETAYWWLSPRGWQTVAFEYVKMAVYYAYY